MIKITHLKIKCLNNSRWYS